MSLISRVALASRSPRRQELLKQIGVTFELIDVDIDENWNKEEGPEDYVCRVAVEKALAGKSSTNTSLPILAADTAVVIDREILGKAETTKDVINMLERLSGKTHYVLSAVCLLQEQHQTLLNISKVTFRELSHEEIYNYAGSKEPVGKAGGYAIQGYAAVFIKKLEGSYSGVMGLPLHETWQLLNAE